MESKFLVPFDGVKYQIVIYLELKIFAINIAHVITSCVSSEAFNDGDVYNQILHGTKIANQC